MTLRVITDIHAATDFLQSGSALTIGTYDGVHVGHTVILDRLVALARQGSLKSVLVTFRPHPKQVVAPMDAPQLLTTYDEKLTLLEGRGIDAVCVVKFDRDFAQLTAHTFLKDYLVERFSCRHVVIGYNHAFGYRRQGDASFLKEHSVDYGYEFSMIDPIIRRNEPVHSSRIREEILSGDYSFAVEMLGHDYTITGKVVCGKGLGKQLGYPTLNLKTPPEKLIPPPGVYAAYAEIAGERHFGMMFIPDVVTEFTLEVNLFDFDRDLYDQTILVCPTRFIRKTIRFENRQDLIEQIGNDKREIRNVFDLN